MAPGHLEGVAEIGQEGDSLDVCSIEVLGFLSSRMHGNWETVLEGSRSELTHW